MRVKLYTADGGFVHETTIPPFTPMPDILMWGQRFFQLDPVASRRDSTLGDPHQVYVEVFAYYIVGNV